MEMRVKMRVQVRAEVRVKGERGDESRGEGEAARRGVHLTYDY